jgi:hypothetical protein
MEKFQRNVIYEAVVAGGLDPRECTFDYGDAGARITHLPSASYFVLEGDINQYTAKAVVGESERWPGGLPTFWIEVKARVRGWAMEVKRDVDTPDLWAELQREREILTGARYADVENTPFSSDEQAAIVKHLRVTKEYVARTHSLSDPQVLHLEAQLDDIAAAAGRMGRKDWTLLVCGALLGALVQGILPPEAVQDILRMTLEGLGYLLLGGGGGGPQLPPVT